MNKGGGVLFPQSCFRGGVCNYVGFLVPISDSRYVVRRVCLAGPAKVVFHLTFTYKAITYICGPHCKCDGLT